MFQEILNALKAKFQGVSENILVRIATKLAQTNTTAEQVKATVDAYTLQQVIDSYADHRATEASQTAVSNYEKKYGLKDGAKADITDPNKGGAQTTTVTQPQTTPPNGGGEQTPAWAQTLIEQNKALTDRIGKLEGERTTTNRKQQLSTIVAKLPEQLRQPYELIAVDGLSDEQFTTLVSQVTTQVDGLAKDINAKGAVFGRPSAQSGQQENGTLTKEQQDAIAHRDAVTSDQKAQPF